MKKLIVTLTAATLIITAAKAQDEDSKPSKAYARVGVGYAFPHAGDTYAKTITTSALSTSYEFKKYSLGAGANATIAGGYWFSRYLGAELGVNIGVAGRKFEMTYTDNTDPSRNYTSSMRSKMPVYVMPAVVLQTGGDNLNVYSRIGLAVNVAGKMIEEFKGDGYEEEWEYRFNTGIGFHGALGVMIPAGERLSIFAEATGIAMSQYVKKAELTKATEGGVDILSELDPADKMIEFENEITLTNATPDPNTPSKEARYSEPFSNAGLTVGVWFKF